jgi:hypothetical protein
MQQNQRVYKDTRRSSSFRPAYSLICIGLPQRGQGSPSPGMMMHFCRVRRRLKLPPQPPAPLTHKSMNARRMRASADQATVTCQRTATCRRNFSSVSETAFDGLLVVAPPLEPSSSPSRPSLLSAALRQRGTREPRARHPRPAARELADRLAAASSCPRPLKRAR